jgi:hypothetical protein
MNLHDARAIVSSCIDDATESEQEAQRLKADGALYESLVSSLIQAVSVADPRGDDTRAAGEAAETWVANFTLPSDK